jgi:para-nitrobenzyl esterase
LQSHLPWHFPVSPLSLITLVYVFSNLRPENKAFRDVDFKLSEMMTSYWVNFATTGDPNGTGLPKWTPYDLGAEPYLEFGDTIQLRNHLLKEPLDFLEEFQRSSSAAN